MNAVACIPAAGGGNPTTGEGLPATVPAASAPSALLASLFPSLLGDLLEAAVEPGGESGKRQDGPPAMGLVAPAAAPAPIPPSQPLLALWLQSSGKTQLVESPIPGESPMPGESLPAASVSPANPAEAPAPPSAEVALEAPNCDMGLTGAPDPDSDGSAAVFSVASDAVDSSAPNVPQNFIISREPPAAASPMPGAGLTPTMLEAPNVSTATPSPQPRAAGSGSDSGLAALPRPTPAPDPGDTALSTEDPRGVARGAQPARADFRHPAPDLLPLSPPQPSAPAPSSAEPVRMELAFAARLSAAPKPAAPHPGMPAQAPQAPTQPEAPISPVEPAGNGAPPHADSHTQQGPEPATRNIAPLAAEAEPKHGDGAARDSTAPPGMEFASPVREGPAARDGRGAPAAEQHRAATPAEPAPSAPSPARDIHLQVRGGEQRVDVRLTERGGQVDVSVRTPDARLTEALRGDLPALSARLEQSGFRAETWHPGAVRIEHNGLAPEPAWSGSAPQDQGGQRHGRPQDHEPPPPPAPRADGKNHSEGAPQEFSWLFSSLR